MSFAKDISSSNDITQITTAFDQLNLIDFQNPEDIYWLGYCYEHGIEVEKDEDKAFIHYQKSANMNNSNGIYQVGYCYHLGIGVETNRQEAFLHYQKSAEAGNSMGIFKTAICYFYGIGVEKDEAKFYEWIEKDAFYEYYVQYRHYTRESDYGKCTHCNEYNTHYAWCQTCDPDIMIHETTSRNKDIDAYIKEFQLRTREYEGMIEWIPFDRLENIKTIGRGGFGTVFSAIWLDGIRTINADVGNYIKAREKYSMVALKALPDSKKNSLDFLKEFDNNMKCRMHGSRLNIYGLTQNKETNEFMMVFQYADYGSLHKFLGVKFRDLNWKTKIGLLRNILYDLYMIHSAGYVHADLHSGNILQNKSMQSFITDLGLSKNKRESVPKGSICGVMPYIAPEVLSGKKFEEAADIYSIGVIMSEMSTGLRPFDGYTFDIGLALKICNGLRPEFAPGTPKCYVELALECMDSNPHKRPPVSRVYRKLKSWYKIMENSNKNEIYDQFLEADKIIKELPIISSKHPDYMYTSKIIDAQKISNTIKDSTLVELNDTKKFDMYST